MGQLRFSKQIRRRLREHKRTLGLGPANANAGANPAPASREQKAAARADLARMSMHTEGSGFRGVSFGAQKQGIHGAAGPDKMHLVYEGLGKYLIEMLIKMLQQKPGATVRIDR